MMALLARSATLITIAFGGVAALALALALTLPLGRRIRRDRLELAWWIEHPATLAGASLTPGSAFVVRCELRHYGFADIEIASMMPLMNEGLDLLELPQLPLRLEARSIAELRIRLRPQVVGRQVIQGLALTLRGPLGLFEIPLYFASPLHLKVLPRAFRRTRSGAHSRSGLRHRVGRAEISRRGSGMDLYELRELVPGDPFRSIAWKASARHGRLMVKEVEQQVERAHWVLLDVGGTMRGGKAGSRKLDIAIEKAAGWIDQAITENERIGLITIDDRVLTELPPDEGASQRKRAIQALLDATEVVDGDLTQPSDAEVIATLSRFLRLHGSVNFGEGAELNEAALSSYLRVGLMKESPHARPIVAESELGILARRYCRMQGVPIAHHADGAPGAKDHALAHALQIVARRSDQPTSILWISDLDGLIFSDELLASVRLARRHGHALRLLFADARSLAPDPGSKLEEGLHVIYGHGEDRRLREARHLFSPLGVRIESLKATKASKAEAVPPNVGAATDPQRPDARTSQDAAVQP